LTFQPDSDCQNTTHDTNGVMIERRLRSPDYRQDFGLNWHELPNYQGRFRDLIPMCNTSLGYKVTDQER